VLAQGLPIPHNRSAAERMIRALEKGGATPAITAVIRGEVRVGVEDNELEVLLSRDGVAKVSSRDLAFRIAEKGHGATTVAATLTIARAAGIHVFATGGIGGVHREPAEDESADLLELARSPVVVVCSGAKSILNLAATFERLETLGVMVVGFRTREVPGFFTRGTGLEVSEAVGSASEVAVIWRAARQVGHPGALLVLNPLPEDEALPETVVDRAVEEALAEGRRRGIRGSAVTPFLLAEVERATGGASLRANLALLERNAALGGEIAVALARFST
jgi:pseudouridylate synthase